MAVPPDVDRRLSNCAWTAGAQSGVRGRPRAHAQHTRFVADVWHSTAHFWSRFPAWMARQPRFKGRPFAALASAPVGRPVRPWLFPRLALVRRGGGHFHFHDLARLARGHTGPGAN